MESQAHGVRASILVLAPDGRHLRHGAAPSLPEAYNRAVDGIAIGEGEGSCGTAAFRGAPVIVADIETDPLWRRHRELARAHGLRACWSTPILDGKRNVLGTFALYHGVPTLPDDHHRSLVESACHIAAIAIVRQREESALRESERQLAAAQAQAHLGSWQLDLERRRGTWSAEMF
ncbi:MAG TPA: GAF domain-containing protein, partial [Cellvibrionaceae bacterium]|nr:GAF domain-containing protein [Cellvibrionaceae bacterium]